MFHEGRRATPRLCGEWWEGVLGPSAGPSVALAELSGLAAVASLGWGLRQEGRKPQNRRFAGTVCVITDYQASVGYGYNFVGWAGWMC